MSQRRGLMGLVLLIALVGTAHAIWIVQDRGLQRAPDDYGYLYGALRLADTVSGVGPAGLPSLEELSLGGRPPLYQIVTIPFVLALGRSIDAAMAVNGFFLILLMVTTYLLTRRRGGTTAGALLACTLVATFPPIVHLLHAYRALAALPACGALSLWLLVELLERRTPSWAIAFWLSILFGAAMHPAFIYTMAVPAAFGTGALLLAGAQGRITLAPRLEAWLGSRVSRSLLSRGIAPGIVMAGAPLALWYLGPGRNLYEAMLRIAASKTLTEQGVAISRVEALEKTVSPWWYLVTTPTALGLVVALLVLPAVAIALLRQRGVTDWILPLTVISTSVVLTALERYNWKYFAPALPAVAILVALMVARLAPRVKTVATSIVVATSAFVFAWSSWGHPGHRAEGPALMLGAVATASNQCLHSWVFCAQPPGPSPITDAYEPVLEYVLQSPHCTEGRTCQLMVIGKSTVSSRMFSFLMIQRWPHARLTIVDQGTRNFGLSFPVGNLLDSTFIVYRRNGPRHRAGHQLDNVQIAQTFLRRPPPAFRASFRQIKRFPSPRGPLILLRRERAILGTQRQEIVRGFEARVRTNPPAERGGPKNKALP